MMDMPRILTLEEVAAAANITHGSAREYHKRATARRRTKEERITDLPAPTLVLGKTPGWAEPVVQAWVETRRKHLR